MSGQYFPFTQSVNELRRAFWWRTSHLICSLISNMAGQTRHQQDYQTIHGVSVCLPRPHNHLDKHFINKCGFDLPETEACEWVCVRAVLPLASSSSQHLSAQLSDWPAHQHISDPSVTLTRRGKMSWVRTWRQLLLLPLLSSQPLTTVIDANEKLGQWVSRRSCQESWQESEMRRQRREAKPIAGTWLIRKYF